jgi:hypothetical protein
MSIPGVWDGQCRAEDKLYMRCVNDSSERELVDAAFNVVLERGWSSMCKTNGSVINRVPDILRCV